MASIVNRLLRTRLLPYCSATAKTGTSRRSYTKTPFLGAHLLHDDATSPLFSRFFKIGAFTSIAVAVGATAYVSCAYTLDEVDQMTRYRQSVPNTRVEDDKSGLEKFRSLVRSSVISFTVKSMELYLDMRRAVEEEVRCFTEPLPEKLLPDLPPEKKDTLTLVLDLNETLVYTEWERGKGWRTSLRPDVDDFLEHMSKHYEIILYSDRDNLYVDPVLEKLVRNECISSRLSRSANRYVNGKHQRDLSLLNRDPARILYLSAHAQESCLQPENSMNILPWRSDYFDGELFALIPFLQYMAITRTADVRKVLATYQGYDIVREFYKRAQEYPRIINRHQNRDFSEYLVTFLKTGFNCLKKDLSSLIWGE